MAIYGRYANQWGIAWSFLSALLWSTTFIGSRYLLGSNKIDPLSLSFVRFFIAGIILLIGAFFICPKKLFSLDRKDIGSLIVLSLTGITGMSLFLFWGLRYTTAMNGSMIIGTSPIFIMLFGLFIGEHITRHKALGLIICLIGCMLVINMVSMNGIHYDITHGKGDLLVLMSGICWAVYSVFGKKTVYKLGGYVTTTWVVIFGAVEMFLLLAVINNNTVLPTSGSDWLIVIYIAIFPSAIAFFAYYEALRLIELSLLNIMQYLTPVCTIFLAFFVLGETVTGLNIVGILLVLTGVMLTTGKLPIPARKSLSRQC